MDLKQRAARIRDLLAKIAPQNAVEAVARPPRSFLESLGPDGAPQADRRAETIDRSLHKLAENRVAEVTADEADALEAIVLPQNRPVVFVRNGGYDTLDEPWTSLNDAGVRKRLDPLLPMIGRIEVPNSPLVPYAGTGFIVGRNRLMTNRHVACLFSTGLGQVIKYRAGDAAVDFKLNSREDDQSSYVRVRKRGDDPSLLGHGHTRGGGVAHGRCIEFIDSFAR
jgi:hypothetical protein